MSHYYVERKSVILARTAILGAVVAVLEISRFLRIPFPLAPFLKFDVVGIPMFVAFLSLGFIPGATTTFVSFAIISFRDPFSGFMKCLAEFSTIIGAYFILKGKNTDVSRKRKIYASGSSIIFRVLIMAVANVFLFPIFRGWSTIAVISLLPFTCPFNAIQGAISITGGFFIHEAVARRLPSIKAFSK